MTIGTARQLILFLMSHQDDLITQYKLTVVGKNAKRSLNANSYFHVLCDKLSKAIGRSMAFTKNMLVGRYGAVEWLSEGEYLVYKTNAPPEYMMEQETPHTRLIKVTKEKGKEVYFYAIYKATRDYTVKEFQRLLEGTIDECKEQGIETMTPKEIEKLLAKWESKSED